MTTSEREKVTTNRAIGVLGWLPRTWKLAQHAQASQLNERECSAAAQSLPHCW
jgi:hypothetical protein